MELFFSIKSNPFQIVEILQTLSNVQESFRKGKKVCQLLWTTSGSGTSICFQCIYLLEMLVFGARTINHLFHSLTQCSLTIYCILSFRWQVCLQDNNQELNPLIELPQLAVDNEVFPESIAVIAWVCSPRSNIESEPQQLHAILRETGTLVLYLKSHCESPPFFNQQNITI